MRLFRYQNVSPKTYLKIRWYNRVTLLFTAPRWFYYERCVSPYHRAYHQSEVGWCIVFVTKPYHQVRLDDAAFSLPERITEVFVTKAYHQSEVGWCSQFVTRAYHRDFRYKSVSSKWGWVMRLFRYQSVSPGFSLQKCIIKVRLGDAAFSLPKCITKNLP